MENINNKDKMTAMEAIKERHSVRSYTTKEIDSDVLAVLRDFVEDCNRESGLNIQLCINEPTAFSGAMARYGSFSNVSNYIALVGKKNASLDEKCGYYGEKIVIKSQQLGLNTCWVALTFSKSKSKSAVKIGAGEKLLMVISLGYGVSGGNSRKTKSIEELAGLTEETAAMPDWFKKGMEAVQLAPTAMNQQKFTFTLDSETVTSAAGRGIYTVVDLGIAKYHFEIGAQGGDWKWGKQRA